MIIMYAHNYTHGHAIANIISLVYAVYITVVWLIANKIVDARQLYRPIWNVHLGPVCNTKLIAALPDVAIDLDCGPSGIFTKSLNNIQFTITTDIIVHNSMHLLSIIGVHMTGVRRGSVIQCHVVHMPNQICMIASSPWLSQYFSVIYTCTSCFSAWSILKSLEWARMERRL